MRRPSLPSRYRLAWLRWALPPHKYTALLAGHRVTHCVRLVVRIPLTGVGVGIERNIDARIETQPAPSGRLAERVSEGAKQK